MTVIKNNREIEPQILKCLNVLKNVFGTDLISLYLYGSTILGG